MINYEDLLGIPYKKFGRDKKGYDCYGLAIVVLKRMGYQLTDLIFQQGNISTLDIVEKCDYSDIVIFFDHKGRTIHIGVCLDGETFIHCDNLGVRLSKISEYSRNRRYFRWQK